MPAAKSKKPAARKYEVVGWCAVLGNEPGSTFEADLSDFDHQRFTTGGHLKEVKG
ncbi:MAG: hypothetical protein HKN81_01985 [Gammaproteobacteria bacterium]|nr:hypothetical protein [Gammaproteobacteria bacterium]